MCFLKVIILTVPDASLIFHLASPVFIIDTGNLGRVLLSRPLLLSAERRKSVWEVRKTRWGMAPSRYQPTPDKTFHCTKAHFVTDFCGRDLCGADNQCLEDDPVIMASWKDRVRNNSFWELRRSAWGSEGLSSAFRMAREAQEESLRLLVNSTLSSSS